MPERDTQSNATENTYEYTIQVEGVLDTTWSEWFDGMTVIQGSDNTTVISGHMVDQAALHRVVRKIRDLGVALISIQRGGFHEVKQYRANQFSNAATKRRKQ